MTGKSQNYAINNTAERDTSLKSLRAFQHGLLPLPPAYPQMGRVIFYNLCKKEKGSEEYVYTRKLILLFVGLIALLLTTGTGQETCTISTIRFISVLLWI